MEIRAFTKSARISPRKARLVADAIRNLPANSAVDILTLTRKRAAQDILKTVLSAMSNAKVKGANDGLYITKIEVNEGPALKRFMPSTRGRIHPYKKKTSHITVILSDSTNQSNKKQIIKEEKEQPVSAKQS
jgi:large subunit ribosomal protein L22